MTKKIIPIDALKPQTYVLGIAEAAGEVKVQKPGWVRSQNGVERLRAMGVRKVIIDPDKSPKSDEEMDKARIGVEQATDSSHKVSDHANDEPEVPLTKELEKATRLYDEAREFQKKAFEKVRQGAPLDLAPVASLTDSMMTSLFRNQDALLCLTRMRTKDAYLLEHSINVSILMMVFARALGLDEALIRQLAQGAFLHDIGKIRIPDKILNKPGRLTPEEYEIMKKHATYSAEVVSEIAGMADVSKQVVARHHERVDGQGYPRGLSASELTMYDKMISIVDVYDAMTADRVYKEGMVPFKALKLMRGMAGSHFDEPLLMKFIAVMGLHPVGTLVKLDSGKIGMVIKSNRLEPLKPVVKVFYNAKSKTHVAPYDLDLGDRYCQDSIEKAIKPEDFRLDLLRFFKESML